MHTGSGESFTVGSAPLQSAAALFSWASVFELVPPLAASCVNTPSLNSSASQPCGRGDLPTGISCGSPECGRPADWPSSQPFYLPFDLYNASVWDEIGTGPSQALVQAGEPPRALTPTERSHLQVRATL